MADVMTDPRWQRTYGTFGEDPELIYEIMDHIIPRIQGSAEGVTPQGVAVTTKHFPGGGARENGFDPHYADEDSGMSMQPRDLYRSIIYRRSKPQ
ncbi:MAG: glycoside hydrolase family 3 N-terminal domain-containing protein [Mediterraneibacter gnavus]